MHPHSNFVHSEVYRFGAVQYTLRAKPVDGGYFGHWACGACGATGASRVKDDNLEMAMWSAQANLAEHHHSKHEGDRLPPRFGRASQDIAPIAA